MTDKTYVHEGVEVKPTGRTAVKISRGVGGKEGRQFVLHEITPADSFLGDWKKWVRFDDLFEVVEKE